MEIIREALRAYGMENAAYVMIRHNENITCKVTCEGQDYALRIHQPVEGFCASLITYGKNDMELVQNEIKLLQHMYNNGFTTLQRPVPNIRGEYMTKLRCGVPAMLLTWVEGRPIDQKETDRYAEQIGELAGRIHKTAEGFDGVRIDYDNALCDRMIEEIGKAVSLGHIAEEAGKRCIRELKAVKVTQKKLQEKTGCCIIHSDLGFSNILVTDHGLVPIDFSLSGYSSPAQEAGMILSNYHDEESRKKVLNGFQKAGVEIHPMDAEIFLAYSILLFICVQHHKVYKEEWFADTLKQWCEEFVHEA